VWLNEEMLGRSVEVIQGLIVVFQKGIMLAGLGVIFWDP
jgi:hypothetical protein